MYLNKQFVASVTVPFTDWACTQKVNISSIALKKTVSNFFINNSLIIRF